MGLFLNETSYLMLKSILFLLLTIICLSVVAQHRYLVASNEFGKKIIFEDNDRVRMQLFGRKKFSGRLKIVDDHTLYVDGFKLDLQNLQSIKHNPLLMTLSTSIALAYVGVNLFAIGILYAVVFESPAAFAIVGIPAIAAFYGTYKGPNFLKSFKKYRGWSYEIITI